MDHEDSIRLDILMGLRAGLKLCHGMRRQLDERQQHAIVDAIMKQLRLSKVEFVEPPAYKPWHFRP